MPLGLAAATPAPHPALSATDSDRATAALGYLLAYASTPGDLGTIANWEQHLLTYDVDGQAARIEKVTGKKLPAEALVGNIIFCYHQNSRSSLVQPVNNPGP